MRLLKMAIVMTVLLTIDLKTGFSQENSFVNNVFKIGIITSDLNATLDFYMNVFGMIKVREFDIDSATSYKFGLTKGIPFHVVSLKTENSTQATELKILSFDKTISKNKPQYLQLSSGMQFITITVKSMDQFIKRLKDKNIKLLGETPTPITLKNLTPAPAPSGEISQLVLVQDPNGVFIEIIGKK